jgi:hypothetical protein
MNLFECRPRTKFVLIKLMRMTCGTCRMDAYFLEYDISLARRLLFTVFFLAASNRDVMHDDNLLSGSHRTTGTLLAQLRIFLLWHFLKISIAIKAVGSGHNQGVNSSASFPSRPAQIPMLPLLTICIINQKAFMIYRRTSCGASALTATTCHVMSLDN